MLLNEKDLQYHLQPEAENLHGHVVFQTQSALNFGDPFKSSPLTRAFSKKKHDSFTWLVLRGHV